MARTTAKARKIGLSSQVAHVDKVIAMNQKCVFLGLFVCSSVALAGQEQVVPAPAFPAKTASEPVISLSHPRRIDEISFTQQINLLKTGREALHDDRQAAIKPADMPDVSILDQSRKIQETVAILAVQLSERRNKPSAESESNASPPVGLQAPLKAPLPKGASPGNSQDPNKVRVKNPPPKPPVQAPVVKPPDQKIVVNSSDLVDPMALAQALVGTADYAGALEAYRKLDMKGLKIKDKLFVQYMTANCLRKLGKIDDAATLYREVASSKLDPILADCTSGN